MKLERLLFIYEQTLANYDGAQICGVLQELIVDAYEKENMKDDPYLQEISKIEQNSLKT
jgi:hypothetical protein